MLEGARGRCAGRLGAAAAGSGGGAPGVATPDRSPWTLVAPLPTPRAGLAAATAPDGRIYAIGGRNHGLRSTVEVYDPGTNTWSEAAPMPTARDELAAATGPDGKIYAIGGWRGKPLGTVEAYDPATNTWSERAPLPTPRAGLAAATGADGRIYAMGGGTADHDSVRTVEAYDVTTNRWTSVRPMIVAVRDLAAATASGGRIYALGGDSYDNYCGGAESTDWMEAYSPATGRWTEEPFYTDADRLALVFAADKLFAIGGFSEGASGSGCEWSRLASADVDVFDVARQHWVGHEQLHRPRFALAAAVGGDGRIYAIGGRTRGGRLTATVEALAPTSG